MKIALFVIALLFSTHALADDATKREKIRQLIKAQGLEQMFQEQIEQSKASAATMGNEIFDKMAQDTGVEAGLENPKVKQLFLRFNEDLADLLTVKEYVDTWTRSFGKDLSETDIDDILKYYRSPVGQREVEASRSAMRSFTQAIIKEQMVRMTALTEKLAKDLKATTTP